MHGTVLLPARGNIHCQTVLAVHFKKGGSVAFHRHIKSRRRFQRIIPAAAFDRVSMDGAVRTLVVCSDPDLILIIIQIRDLIAARSLLVKAHRHRVRCSCHSSDSGQFDCVDPVRPALSDPCICSIRCDTAHMIFVDFVFGQTLIAGIAGHAGRAALIIVQTDRSQILA